MFTIALTGGIASGKSVVANRLVELGATLVDADAIAREVVEPGTAGLAAIEEAFGAEVIAPDGSLNRPALAAIVFNDPAKRRKLNEITHPLIAERSAELIRVADDDAVVVRDIPLLVEVNPRSDAFDLVVVVQADRQRRLERMMQNRGMSLEEASARIEAQASDAERLEIADVVIDNDGELRETLQQVDELWASLPGRPHRRVPAQQRPAGR